MSAPHTAPEGTVRVHVARDCEDYPVTHIRAAEWGDEFTVAPAELLAEVVRAEAALKAAKDAVLAYVEAHPEAYVDPWEEPDGLHKYWPITSAAGESRTDATPRP